MRLARVLLVVLLFSSMAAAYTIPLPTFYPTETYHKTLTVHSIEDANADKDYSDGKVTYLYLLHLVYSYPSAEKVFSKYEELESVRKGYAYKCRFNLPITREMSGKYLVMCTLIKITGNVDINTGTWNFGWKNIGDDNGVDVFKVKKIPRPPQPNIIARIIEILVNFFKSMLGG